MAPHSGDLDSVNNPQHYRHGKYETLDYIFAVVDTLPGDEAVCVSQILKYVSRYNKKENPLQDIEKAEFYTKQLIKLLKEKGVDE